MNLLALTGAPDLTARALFRLLIVTLVATLGGASGCGAQETPVAPVAAPPVLPLAAPVRHVFIVSFDGGNPEEMKRSAMPTFWRMANEGASTMKAQTIFPSKTLPSHLSMLTGVGPETHKILWNEYLPAKGELRVPTIFSLAKAHDPALKTALFAGKEKFKTLRKPGGIDVFEIPAYEAQTVARSAAAYIKAEKPNLCFVHFADSDGAGHKYGWGSREQLQSFADEDAALGTLEEAVRAAGIDKSSVFLLTADHGGHDKGHGSDDPRDMTIPWVAYGASVRAATPLTAHVTTYDTAATALMLLQVPLPQDWKGQPVASAFESLQPVGALQPLETAQPAIF